MDDDLDFQRRQWQWQRRAWAGLGAFVICGALGAFGDGPLSRARGVSDDASLDVSYSRFLRSRAESTIRVEAAGPAHHRLLIEFDREYAHAAGLRPASPPPLETTLSAESITYTFGTAPLARVAIEFSVKPDSAQVLRGVISRPGGSPLTFRQLVFP